MIAYFLHQMTPFLVNLSQICLWFAILCVIFVPLERLFAVHRQPVFRPGIWTDLCYYLMSALLPAVLLSLPVSALVWVVHHFVPWRVQTLGAHAPFWQRAVVSLVLGDVAYYWAHRWMHTVPWLWRFHAVHHSPTQIDFLVSSRMHPVDLFLSRFSGLVPLYVLGLTGPIAPADTVLATAVIAIGKLWGYFIHANLRWRFGPLAWVLTTPRFHHWHHTLTPVNRNYASMLPWLDRIFGTYYAPGGAFPQRYGVDDVVSDDLSQQLVAPFLEKWPHPSRANVTSGEESG